MYLYLCGEKMVKKFLNYFSNPLLISTLVYMAIKLNYELQDKEAWILFFVLYGISIIFKKVILHYGEKLKNET